MKKSLLFVFVLTGFFIPSSFSKNFIQTSSSVDDSLKIIEKVYLHVDRDTYFVGDDIWFKAYLVDAFDRLLIGHSSNLHVELISQSSKIVSKRIIRLEKGLGNGDFRLSDSINSGKYIIRAYTNYMRNFGDQLFFTKEISVINANEPQAQIRDTVKYENNIRINFFPEGGSLIDDVSSVVAFKAENYLGKGCDISGKIFSSDGKLITTFKSTHLGMGSFFLRPLPDLKYYSVVRGADSVDIRTELPKCFSTGISLSAAINQNQELLITAKTNPETLSLVTDHDLLLSFSIRKEVFKTIPFRIKSSVTSFVIPTDDLPDGILMLSLSTLKDLPLSERLVYNEREVPLKIQIKTDKSVYEKREPVTLRISLPGDSTIEYEGNVSLSAANENLTDNSSQYPGTISSWFLLESDVRGIIENPSYYFDSSNPDRLRALDLLLLTQGWRDFAWRYDKINFPVENGFTISGKLRKDKKNRPDEELRVSVGIFGNQNTLLTTIPLDSNGIFRLSDIELTGKGTLIATGIGKKDHLVGIMTLDSVIYNPAEIPERIQVVSILAEKNQSNLKSYFKINEALRKKYKLSDTINVGEVNIISERHKDPQIVKVERSRLKYGRPDDELIVTESMDGYRNVPELMRGRFSGVEVVGPKDGEYAIYIRGIASFDTLGGVMPPLVLIDGNPAIFEDLINIPTSIIDRIDVLKLVSSTVIFGLQGYNGVINLITKAGGVRAIYKPVKYSASCKISGYSASRIFYSPQHLPNSVSDFKPDLRSTLYWKPDINLEGSKEAILNYYNGDNSSLIRIVTEGITTNGIPVTGKAEYEVR